MERTNMNQQDKPNQAPNSKQRSRQKSKKQKRTKKPIRRIFPIWLRLIVIFLLAIFALILGMIIGFSVLGDGNPLDVLSFDFWRHVLDIINGVE
ncbi:DNA-directed RNA polymerase subunit beta [Amphibacillus sp. MSJ-3]|uniref:DNA-directed RNA polymerase subunit beta n=1 Tax=Amphibacillus sp. MSJ-3 TaxID=2841505 RepID=UPI001C0EEFB7|nr:DNA-directed RNA polymerase subunit beta [Amphibacillus sp. MSJ-3]MBU5594358.1 DNA-directed RNA polymerase subunit beta [Amphibacillus sp. MSJ-3]